MYEITYTSSAYPKEGIEAFAKEIAINANFLAEDIPAHTVIEIAEDTFKIEIDIEKTTDEFDHMMATYEKAVWE